MEGRDGGVRGVQWGVFEFGGDTVSWVVSDGDGAEGGGAQEFLEDAQPLEG